MHKFMIKSFRFLKPYVGWVILIFILVALRAVMTLSLPFFLKELINDVVSVNLTNTEKYQSLLHNGLLMLGSTVIGIIAVLFSGFLEARVSSAYGKDLRNALYSRVQQFSLKEMDHFTTSSLITRTTNDIQSLQMMLAQLMRSVIMAPVMAIGGLVMAFVLSPNLTVFLGISVVVITIFYNYFINYCYAKV